MFSNFPKDSSLLNGIEVVVVDTVARTHEKYDRTEALSTLYIDPKLIDQASWQTLSRFAGESYSKSDKDNPLLQWLNYGYNIGNTSDSVFTFNTIYALVYTNLSAIEPQYTSADGRKVLKVGVDKFIYFKDNTEESPGWLYTGRLTDSVFQYWPGRAELVNEFAEYDREGIKFKSLYRGSQAER
jgi:hypothetical protein